MTNRSEQDKRQRHPQGQRKSQSDFNDPDRENSEQNEDGTQAQDVAQDALQVPRLVGADQDHALLLLGPGDELAELVAAEHIQVIGRFVHNQQSMRMLRSGFGQKFR